VGLGGGYKTKNPALGHFLNKTLGLFFLAVIVFSLGGSPGGGVFPPRENPQKVPWGFLPWRVTRCFGGTVLLAMFLVPSAPWGQCFRFFLGFCLAQPLLTLDYPRGRKLGGFLDEVFPPFLFGWVGEAIKPPLIKSCTPPQKGFFFRGVLVGLIRFWFMGVFVRVLGGPNGPSFVWLVFWRVPVVLCKQPGGSPPPVRWLGGDGGPTWQPRCGMTQECPYGSTLLATPGQRTSPRISA